MHNIVLFKFAKQSTPIFAGVDCCTTSNSKSLSGAYCICSIAVLKRRILDPGRIVPPEATTVKSTYPDLGMLII